ncbi:MAG: MBL fold metallo-hydrolase [Acidimicrobiales bacterium]|nr:MBL fold metallo-hydrolase [Acidimicrobiales bacterium]
MSIERDEQGRNPATDHTIASQQAFASTLPPDDPRDTERATRGFIASREQTEIANENTTGAAQWMPVAWDTARWAFVDGDAPDSVNPSLWRQAKLNGVHGLFEIIPGFYQVRSHDTSCTTFIRGTEGWVVIDPLTTIETAKSALELVHEHLENLPVTAVVYTHSHVDHFGGCLGMIDRADVEAGKIPIVAPEGFLHAAVAENVAAGAAMGRRATYQYGMLLPWDERGHVDQGLGKGVPVGQITMVAPTIDITHTGQELTLDGVRFEFQLTPDSEAPAEMHFYFPDHKLLCLAENCTGTMHNVLTLRGAVVRDALAWSRYIEEALDKYGDEVEACFASHSWPHWGRDDVIDYMTKQRDLYRWIHDETMRLVNLGHTPDEIADMLELPPGLWNEWSCHGYYGTLSHNVRAVYQRYLGFYDGHPSSLHPYPPVESAERYVEFMGGVDALVAKAQQSYDAGDYRWVAQVLRHAVFADPAHEAARHLQADAFEQLGYQAEAGPWRDVYLMGAMELRTGTLDVPAVVRPILENAKGMTLHQIFDYLAIRLDGSGAVELGDFELVWEVTDTADTIGIGVSNGTMHGWVGRVPEAPVATVRAPRSVLDDLVAEGGSIAEAIAAGTATVEGDATKVVALWDLMADFKMFFPIVEP